MDKFYYEVGRVRAIEAHLVTPPQFERMAAANSFEDAFKVFSETPYSDTLTKLQNPFDFEELFKIEMEELKDLLNKLAPENESIKALLKGDFAPLKDSPSPLINAMVKHKFDLQNIKTLLRCQSAKKDKDFLAANLKETGMIGHDILLKLIDKNVPEIAAKLNYTPYFPAIAPGFDFYEENKSLHLLEKLMDDFIVNNFRKAKYVNSGLEPLIGFYLAKKAEIKSLRFIMICKKNHVQSNQIKERVRVGY
jgi:vacuolar-type H+-ATPase subunit C/Vma6